MTHSARHPYPPVGAVIALWDSPTVWFADARVLRRLDRGDVLLRIVRSADIQRARDVTGKVLRSGRWKIKASTGHRSGSAGVVREQYEGLARSIATQPNSTGKDTLNQHPERDEPHEWKPQTVLNRRAYREPGALASRNTLNPTGN